MRHLEIRPLVENEAQPYDVVLCAVGYENRARNVAKQLSIRGRLQLAVGFPDRHVSGYSENRRWFETNEFTYIEVSDSEFGESVCRKAFSSTSKTQVLRIAIDISSFNRTRLATIVEWLSNSKEYCATAIAHFYYSLASFSEPTHDPAVRNRHVGPVTPTFAGWSEDPMLPPYAVLGLGYENGKALGAIDHLEVSNALAFVPTSPVDEYLPALISANETLINTLGSDHVLRYRVHEPIRTFEMVESVVNGLLPNFNPILLPFGPKIFFVISLLVALLHPECSVWRVSAGESESPSDRTASDHIISFETNFK